MKTITLWTEKYVAQGVSPTVARALTWFLLILVIGSSLVAVSTGVFLIIQDTPPVNNSSGYGTAAIILGVAMVATVLLWPRLQTEPRWLPWAAGFGLLVSAVLAMVDLVYGLVSCVVVVLVLIGLLARIRANEESR